MPNPRCEAQGLTPDRAARARKSRPDPRRAGRTHGQTRAAPGRGSRPAAPPRQGLTCEQDSYGRRISPARRRCVGGPSGAGRAFMIRFHVKLPAIIAGRFTSKRIMDCKPWRPKARATPWAGHPRAWLPSDRETRRHARDARRSRPAARQHRGAVAADGAPGLPGRQCARPSGHRHVRRRGWLPCPASVLGHPHSLTRGDLRAL